MSYLTYCQEGGNPSALCGPLIIIRARWVKSSGVWDTLGVPKWNLKISERASVVQKVDHVGDRDDSDALVAPKFQQIALVPRDEIVGVPRQSGGQQDIIGGIR